MPLFASKEEKLKLREEKKIAKVERKKRQIEAAHERLAESKAIYEQMDAELAEKRAVTQKEIAKLKEEREDIREHNKAVIKDWLGDVREIKQDFVDEQKQITQNNRNKRR